MIFMHNGCNTLALQSGIFQPNYFTQHGGFEGQKKETPAGQAEASGRRDVMENLKFILAKITLSVKEFMVRWSWIFWGLA